MAQFQSTSVTGSLTVTGQVIAQTLNVQQVTSSIVYSSGSNIFGNSLANTQQFTGSVSVTGSLTVTTTGTELQVTSTGVNLGNALTDSHIISGSLRVNPNGLFVSGSGNVGIGTTNPETLSNNTTLQIDGTNHSFVRTGNSSYGGYFATIPTAEVLCIANVRNPVTGTYNNTGKAASGINLFSESSNGYITFLTTATNNSGPSERMRITSGGNVGIGTTNPGYRLNIGGSASSTLGFSPTDANSYTELYFNRNTSTTISYIGVGVNSTVTAAGDEFVIQNNLSTGNIVFRTNGGSGATERIRVTNNGLTFNGDTAAANALDDYEEGTWTPTLPNGGTLTVLNARYVKIGQKVTVSFYIQLVYPTNNSATFIIGGLPFANAGYSTFYTAGSFGYVDTANFTGWAPITGSNFTYIYFHALNGSAASKTNADYLAIAGGNNQIILTITYFAAT